MENQQLSPLPQTVPVQTPVIPTKPKFPWVIILLVIIVALLSAGLTFFLVKGSSIPSLNQTKTTPTMPAVSIQPTVSTVTENVLPTNIVSLPASVTLSPTNATVCDVSDNAFCNVLADLKSALAAKNYAGFLTYQNLQSITCDPDGMYVAICEGVAKGVVKQGYGIGYNQSEGTFVAKNDYVQTVLGYVNSNGPFNYRGSLVSGDKGIAVFLNAKKDHLLIFPMKRSGATWRMDTLILGGTFNDSSFDSLSVSLLDLVK